MFFLQKIVEMNLFGHHALALLYQGLAIFLSHIFLIASNACCPSSAQIILLFSFSNYPGFKCLQLFVQRLNRFPLDILRPVLHQVYICKLLFASRHHSIILSNVEFWSLRAVFLIGRLNNALAFHCKMKPFLSIIYFLPFAMHLRRLSSALCKIPSPYFLIRVPFRNSYVGTCSFSQCAGRITEFFLRLIIHSVMVALFLPFYR